jgi:hypothetical protein
MTERDWELYRLSVVAQQPESSFRDATIAGIKHKLHLLDQLVELSPPSEANRKSYIVGVAMQ